MPKYKIYILLLLTVLLACCGTSKEATQSAAEAALTPEKHQVWQLVAIRGKEVSRTADVMTLTLNPEAGTLRMEGPCNRYGAAYKARLTAQTPDGDRYTLRVERLTGGGTQCPDAEMNAESRHTALIAQADEMVLSAYTLTLWQRGKEVLKYELR